MRLISLITLLFWSSISSSQSTIQPAPREIKEKKIKSIHATIYEETVGGQTIYSTKTYYSVNGYDSLRYMDSILAFKFIPEFNKEGKIKTLTRFVVRNNEEDEIRLYEYLQDGSYTVELVEHGAGTTSFKEYNVLGDCIKEIFSSTDTVFYLNNSLGYAEKVQKLENGKLEIIAVTSFDKNGVPSEITILGEPSEIIRYKTNTYRLPEEVKEYEKAGSKETLIVTIKLFYEFYN